MEEFAQLTHPKSITYITISKTTRYIQKSNPRYRNIADVIKNLVSVLSPSVQKRCVPKINKLLHDACFVAPEIFGKVWMTLDGIVTSIMNETQDVGLQEAIGRIMNPTGN